MRLTIKHACGHKAPHVLRGIRAADASAEAFRLGMHYCPMCERAMTEDAREAYYQALADNPPCDCDGQGCIMCNYTGVR